MGYFGDNSAEEDERRNNAFKLVCALREAISLAKRSPQLIPYRRVNEILFDFSPELQKDVNNLLTKTNESEVVRYYKQKSNLLIKQGNNVQAVDLLKRDIEEHRALLDKDEEDSQIERKIFELEAALEFFSSDEITENQLLNHDFTLESRDNFFTRKIYNNEKIKDYELPDQRILRLRLLHPDKAEQVIGSDLIYEQFDLKTQRVRFVHLQYKTWNTNVLYFSQGNVKDQMEKINEGLCQKGFCHGIEGTRHSDEEYRFPFCSAFLRPTSKIEKPDSKLVTTGVHVPICTARRIQVNDNKITKDNIKNRCLSHKIFEELFITNLLGSRWISFETLDKFYKEKGLISEMGRIRVHAQEVMYQTEEQKQSENH